MNITPNEARKALEDADRIASATRTVAALAGADVVVMMWGAIWTLGFLWSHTVTVMAWPNGFHGLWFALVALGVAVTILMERRRRAPVKNSAGGRIGLFWWALYGYCYLGLAVLGAHGGRVFPDAGPEAAKTIAAVNTLIPMFAYVVMGLWLEQNLFVWIGLALTGVTAVAYFALLPVFFPVMAVAGGGLLFGCGLWMRLRVRRALRGMERHA